jgi:2-dehydropantoate 2-reductase
VPHVVLGRGGVGGLIGAVLAHAGELVTVIVRSEALERHPQELSLESPLGSFSVPVSVAASLELPVEILWITVKATDLRPALNSISSVKQIGIIVPLLNGIDHIALLRDRFGYEKVVPATIAVEAERIAPGKIVQRSPFVRLNISSTGRPLLDSTVQQFSQFGFECKFTDDESTLLWSKLVFLAPFALATTALDRPIGQIVVDASAMAQVSDAVREVCTVAVASGARVDADGVIEAIKSLPRTMRSSMQKDVDGGRLPELDAIAGPIIRGAEAHGLEATATKRFVQAIENRVHKQRISHETERA